VAWVNAICIKESHGTFHHSLQYSISAPESPAGLVLAVDMDDSESPKCPPSKQQVLQSRLATQLNCVGKTITNHIQDRAGQRWEIGFLDAIFFLLLAS
jgi:hypothetical protein